MNIKKSIASIAVMGIILFGMIMISMNHTQLHENQDILKVSYEGSDICVEQVQVQGYHKEVPIVLELRIDMETDQIISVDILEHSESEDYGAYIVEEWFLKKFCNNTAETPFEMVPILAEENNEIVAITGATISSKAVVRGVNRGMEYYLSMKNEIRK